MPDNLDDLLNRAKAIRKDILRMTTEAGSGHPSSSLSADRGRDRAVLRRLPAARPQEPPLARPRPLHPLEGACRAGALRRAGRGRLLPPRQIMTLRKLGSPLEGHPNMTRLGGVEASTGSLGQGLSIGVGHALAARIDKKDYHTYVMTGDGELGEGQVWEAAASRRQVPARQPHRDRRSQPLPADRRRRGGPEHGPDRRQVHRLRLEDPGHQRQRHARGRHGPRTAPAPSRGSPPASSR